VFGVFILALHCKIGAQDCLPFTCSQANGQQRAELDNQNNYLFEAAKPHHLSANSSSISCGLLLCASSSSTPLKIASLNRFHPNKSNL